MDATSSIAKPRNLKTSFVKQGEKHLKTVGVSEFSLREVAKSLEVSHMAAYKHFSNKNELLCEIGALGFSRLIKKFDVILEKEDAVFQRLDQIFHVFLDLAIDSPDLCHLMLGGEIDSQSMSKPFLKKIESCKAVFEEVLSHAQENGEVRPVKIATLQLSIWSTITGFIMSILNGTYPGEMTKEALEASVEDLLGMWLIGAAE